MVRLPHAVQLVLLIVVLVVIVWPIMDIFLCLESVSSELCPSSLLLLLMLEVFLAVRV